MTGEMSRADVTEEAWPVHFAIAREFGGTVRLSDKYQEPYVHIPGKGVVQIHTKDGVFATVYREATKAQVEFCPYYSDDTEMEVELALIAARAVLA